MRIFSFVLLVCLGLYTGVKAQVDITKVTANHKTFIFSDDKHTVHGYIYNTLKEQSSCCGNDAIYLEVKFDQTGKVLSAKTLTGKNDCYKQSVVDIVKNVTWDATGISGTKTIYFEVKPIIPCSGSPGENEYKPIPAVGGNVVADSGDDGKEEFGDNSESSDVSSGEGEEEVHVVIEEEEPVVVEEEEEPVKEEPVVVEEEEEPVKEEPVVVEEEEEPVKEEPVVVEEEEEPVKEEPVVVEEEEEPVKEEPVVVDNGSDASNWGDGDGFLSDEGISSKNESSSNTKTTTPVVKKNGPVKIPPQANIKYVSKGERSPESSHNTTHVNKDGVHVTNPQYVDGESQIAMFIRKELKEKGYCGLVQAAFELEIDPSGQVVGSSILYANTDQAREMIPGIVANIKFKPQGAGANYRSYHQFKTEIVCPGKKPQYDLENVPNVIK